MTTTSSTISSLTRTRSSARDELNVPSQCHYPHFSRRGRAEASYAIPQFKGSVISREGLTTAAGPRDALYGTGDKYAWRGSALSTDPGTPSQRAARLEARRGKRQMTSVAGSPADKLWPRSMLKTQGLQSSSMRSIEDLGSVAAIGYGEKSYYLR